MPASSNTDLMMSLVSPLQQPCLYIRIPLLGLPFQSFCDWAFDIAFFVTFSRRFIVFFSFAFLFGAGNALHQSCMPVWYLTLCLLSYLATIVLCSPFVYFHGLKLMVHGIGLSRATAEAQLCFDFCFGYKKGHQKQALLGKAKRSSTIVLRLFN